MFFEKENSKVTRQPENLLLNSINMYKNLNSTRNSKIEQKQRF